MRKLFCMVTLVAFLAMVSVVPSYAFFADTDIEHDSLALGLGGQKGVDSSISITGVKVFKGINGFGAAFLSRQTGEEGAIQSEIMVGRLQGGFDVNTIRLRGYGEGTRDLYQEIDLKLEFGWFAETPSFIWQSVEWSVGGGTFIDRRDLDDTIDRDKNADLNVNFGFLSFITGEIGHWSTVLRFKPLFDLNDYAIEVATAYSKNITQAVGLEFTTLVQYDTASVTEELNTQYLLQLTYRPGN